MTYKSTSIADLLGKLNRSYFLPAIQRPFVWEPEQIVRLFDSLMQDNYSGLARIVLRIEV